MLVKEIKEDLNRFTNFMQFLSKSQQVFFCRRNHTYSKIYKGKGTRVAKTILLKKNKVGNSLAVQWLGLHPFTAEGPGSIPGWGARIPQAARCGQKNNSNNNNN